MQICSLFIIQITIINVIEIVLLVSAVHCCSIAQLIIGIHEKKTHSLTTSQYHSPGIGNQSGTVGNDCPS